MLRSLMRLKVRVPGDLTGGCVIGDGDVTAIRQHKFALGFHGLDVKSVDLAQSVGAGSRVGVPKGIVALREPQRKTSDAIQPPVIAVGRDISRDEQWRLVANLQPQKNR